MKEPQEKFNKNTPFRMFRPKKAQRCSRCRTKIQANTSAWKPAKNIGSWKPNAVLCHDCVEPKNMEAKREAMHDGSLPRP